MHNPSDKHLQSWYCRQLRSALLFHEPRIAALQVNLKEAYCHTLAISLEIMLYHDDEPLTFDLVWDNGGWRSATLGMRLTQSPSSRSSRQKRSATRTHAGIHSVCIGLNRDHQFVPIQYIELPAANFLLDGVFRQPGNPTAVEGNLL